MKVLFLTIGSFPSIEDHEMYPDLMREFLRHGHSVYVVCARERRMKVPTIYVKENGAHILKVKIGNITKTNIVEKGISTILIERLYLAAIKKYFKDIKFDLVIYPTPPITLCGVVDYIKKRDHARTYLLLKDIFPQNAVDLGMMVTFGWKSIIYRYFRKKEKKLYRVSDKIGCMSGANVEYVLKHNIEVRKRDDEERKQNGRGIIEVCPNCVEITDTSISKEEGIKIRKKYNIPPDKTVFIYGGNLGRPQGIEFMLKCLHSQRKNDEAFFLIVGNGTEYGSVKRYVDKYKSKNIALHQWIPTNEYEKVVAACDVGMIFLDYRFTIPNFPSRLLSYLSAKLPVLAVTDRATDVGKVIVENGFGWWCGSNKVDGFGKMISLACNADRKEIGLAGARYLVDNYTTERSYEIIVRDNVSVECR